MIQRHNEIRDTFDDLAALVWGKVSREPAVREPDTNPALIADLAVRGVWTPQTAALFDIRVTDTDAHLPLMSLPLLRERKRKV